jgi:DNA repair protein RecN (Recombination protein N)
LTGAPGEQPASLAELLAAARRALANAASHDAELGALADRLAEVGYLVADISTDLASYAEAAEVDPARLAAAQERQAVLSGLFRKYGASTAAVLDWSRQAAARLDELEGDDGRVAELSHEREDVRGRLAALAAEISSARAAAATRFAAAVTAELADLAMAAGRVEVELTQRRDPAGLSVGAAQLAFGPDGVDEVELLLSAHTSAPARPLRVAASGGELSRVMLAIEVVLAGADPTSTFVFDEVDAGVGGRAAVEVGRRLARLASTAQVIVVTHLPQVAAFADRHLHVRKNDDGSVVHAGVTALDDAARVRELSRMLAGLEESALAQGHAEELLATAASAKARD